MKKWSRLLLLLLIAGMLANSCVSSPALGVDMVLPALPQRPQLEEDGNTESLAASLVELMAYAQQLELWAATVKEIYDGD